MFNILKNKNGITLIALVITIIVLLILAGISISMLTGNNGVLQKATDAKTKSDEAQIRERIQLAYHSALTKDITGENGGLTKTTLQEELETEFKDKTVTITSSADNKEWTIKVDDVEEKVTAGKILSSEDTPQEITASTPAGTVVITPNNWTTLQGKAISNGDGNAIPLPKDFYYVGGDLDSGLVISDNANDKNKGVESTLVGNQFVWIPVIKKNGEDDFERTSFDSNGNALALSETSGFSGTPAFAVSEPLTNGGYATEENEYNTMKTQVLKYGGFYIGRYEAGVNNTTLRTKVTTDQTIVCKKGVAPYNYVPWGKSVSDIDTPYAPNQNNTDNALTRGATYLAKNMYSSSTSVKSTLVYGVQWDTMCRYIGADNAKKTTDTKSSAELTGSVSTDISKNIYDLAGNCGELTMEGLGSARYYRGGLFGWSYRIFDRNGWTATDFNAEYVRF